MGNNPVIAVNRLKKKTRIKGNIAITKQSEALGSNRKTIGSAKKKGRTIRNKKYQRNAKKAQTKNNKAIKKRVNKGGVRISF
jgi:hypothetical protein